jgi:hypothetical protein
MTTPQKPQKPANTILELPADLQVIYANLARIAHSPSDIVIDFAHMLPGEPRARIRSRVVMTPVNAKLLVRALSENIAKYESIFGEITIPVNNTLADNLFRPFKGPSEPPQKEE